jgi:hypothetical protein
VVKRKRSPPSDWIWLRWRELAGGGAIVVRDEAIAYQSRPATYTCVKAVVEWKSSFGSAFSRLLSRVL